MRKTLHFPSNFFWGAATAAYQVEGGIENTDWAEAARRGRVPPAGMAADHYNRYESDFDLAASLGQNAQRISIEWARIEPEAGVFDANAIAHYRNVIRAMRARGLEPFITIWHFTLPQWFVDKGGFLHPDASDIFARFCTHVFKELHSECSHWATMNEPLVYASHGWFHGDWPPFVRFAPIRFVRVVRRLAAAHKQAYTAMRAISATEEIGIVKHNIYFHTETKNPVHHLVVRFMRWYWNRWFLNIVHTHCDSIGLNYYHHSEYGGGNTYQKSDIGWDIYPEGIYHTLIELKRYGKPIFVAEAGVADATDTHRGAYIKDLAYWVYRAFASGVDVRGFMYWSLLDNYEWAHGFTQKFGLISVDHKTCARTIRPSAHVYARICRENAIDV